MLTSAVVAIVEFCCRRAWLVVAAALLIGGVSTVYVVRNFAINTDSKSLIRADEPWLQRAFAFDRMFPQRVEYVAVVIDGQTPELADEAARKLVAALKDRADVIQSIHRPDGGAYFDHEGLLFLPAADVEKATREMVKAKPFITLLASDQSLRGIMNALSLGATGVARGQASLDDFARPMTRLTGAFDAALAGKSPPFSWRAVARGEPTSQELRRFVLARPVLDFSSLEPGRRATNAIEAAARDLSLDPAHGVRVRMTGTVPLADDEFSTVLDGALVNGVGTIVIVLVILYLALHSAKLIASVAAVTVFGLVTTFALGLLVVHALNLISIAFAVLFVGIGVDFGIQFSVRYREERYKAGTLGQGLSHAAARGGRPLALAAAATAAGFFAFVPTAFRGVSDLGIIAGNGMVIAFFSSITLLPALLTLAKPPGERAEVGYLFLAPLDRFLTRHRFPIIFGTLFVALAGTPLLASLKFDFNPLNLRSPSVESVSTLLDLMKNPDTTTNTIDVPVASVEAGRGVVAKLTKLPEVDKVITIESLIPQDQAPKLAAVAAARDELLPVLDVSDDMKLDPPTDEEDVAAIRRAADAFGPLATAATGDVAKSGAAFVASLRRLADAPVAARESARAALLPPLAVTFDRLRDILQPEPVTLDTLPKDLKDDWVAADGRARVQVVPRGDSNDNATLIRFTKAVLAAEPDATGAPVLVQASGDIVVQAFFQAGALAFASIAVLLFIVLRRVTDVLLTLVPLLVAGLLTLEITVLIGLPLNFANIIALPLLLGLGVAFKIYFVMAWREGQTELLQSSLTRAIFFSAMTTATAFGSLWLSKHPGTSSMGKLLALSLLCTLAAAILFQPALMGPPREKKDVEPA